MTSIRGPHLVLTAGVPPPPGPAGGPGTAGEAEVGGARAAPASTGGPPVPGYGTATRATPGLTGGAPVAAVAGTVVAVVGGANPAVGVCRVSAVGTVTGTAFV